MRSNPRMRDQISKILSKVRDGHVLGVQERWAEIRVIGTEEDGEEPDAGLGRGRQDGR